MSRHHPSSHHHHHHHQNDDAESGKSDEYGYGEDSFDDKMLNYAYHHYPRNNRRKSSDGDGFHTSHLSHHHQHRPSNAHFTQQRPPPQSPIASLFLKISQAWQVLSTKTSACKIFFLFNDSALLALSPFLALYFKQIGMCLVF